MSFSSGIKSYQQLASLLLFFTRKIQVCCTIEEFISTRITAKLRYYKSQENDNGGRWRVLNWSVYIQLSPFTTGHCRWKRMVLLNVQHHCLQRSCSSSSHITFTLNFLRQDQEHQNQHCGSSIPGKCNEKEKKKWSPAFCVCFFVLVLANTAMFPAFLKKLWNWHPERVSFCNSQNLSQGYFLANTSSGKAGQHRPQSMPHAWPRLPQRPPAWSSPSVQVLPLPQLQPGGIRDGGALCWSWNLACLPCWATSLSSSNKMEQLRRVISIYTRDKSFISHQPPQLLRGT